MSSQGIPSSARVAGDSKPRMLTASAARTIPPLLAPRLEFAGDAAGVAYDRVSLAPPYAPREAAAAPPCVRDAPGLGVGNPELELGPRAAPRAWMLAMRASKCAMLRRISSSWVRALPGRYAPVAVDLLPGTPYFDDASSLVPADAPCAQEGVIVVAPVPRNGAPPTGAPLLAPRGAGPRTLGGGDMWRPRAAGMPVTLEGAGPERAAETARRAARAWAGDAG